jgi:hypothetical protein
MHRKMPSYGDDQSQVRADRRLEGGRRDRVASQHGRLTLQLAHPVVTSGYVQ